MTKQDGPLALFPLVKAVPVAVRRIARKVGDNVAQAEACWLEIGLRKRE